MIPVFLNLLRSASTSDDEFSFVFEFSSDFLSLLVGSIEDSFILFYNLYNSSSGSNFDEING
jgi:hypothetical protein